LFHHLLKKNVPVLFIDHHIPTKNKMANTDYLINEKASCTGEIVLDLIKKMNVQIDSNIATALYASLLFDTQNFKNIRNSSKPYEMAAELLSYGAEHRLIQKNLFDNWSVNKMNYLSLLIQGVDYRDQQRIALIKINRKSLNDFQLNSDDVSDFVDLFMGIQSLDMAIVIREEAVDQYKLSFRSRSNEVLSWAQSFGGGGHLYSSGAWVNDKEKNILSQLDSLIHTQTQKKLSS
jgi:bifunctional oligoribonuclease and PAP phosphatase NrnA